MPDDEMPTPQGMSPETQKLLQLGLSQMMGQQPQQEEQLTPQEQLQEALRGSLYDISGRRGATGRTLRNPLPWWASFLQPEVAQSPGFDPYFGQLAVEGDELVFMGKTKTVKHHAPDRRVMTEMGLVVDKKGETTKEKVDDPITVTQALNLPYSWDDDEVAEAIKKMQSAGIQVKGFDDMLSVWGSLVQRASMTYAYSEGERKLTPWDVLDLQKKEAFAAGIDINAANFTGDKTQVHRSVSEFSEGEVWSTMQRTVSEMLGRDPSDDELRDFTYRMNGLASKNPTVSKTITHYKNGEATGSSTHTTPGYGGADMAQDAYESAQADPDYAEYQSATTYYNAALSALGQIGG